jgi:phosphatidylinositol glycan class B
LDVIKFSRALSHSSYGHLTWEWTRGIRSYFYPSVFALLYKLLDVLKIDERVLLILLPRILQALLATYADYRFYVWCNRKKWSLFIIATSWFWFYTGSRTLINSFEAALTTIALSYFPWGDRDGKLRCQSLKIVLKIVYL